MLDVVDKCNELVEMTLTVISHVSNGEHGIDYTKPLLNVNKQLSNSYLSATRRNSIVSCLPTLSMIKSDQISLMIKLML